MKLVFVAMWLDSELYPPIPSIDPIPIDNRSNSCDELRSIAGKLVVIFRNAAVLYESSAPVFTTLATSCESFNDAVRAIQSWLIEGPEKLLLDPAPWYRLTTSLRGAGKVITTLEDEVQSLLRLRYESRSRSKIGRK